MSEQKRVRLDEIAAQAGVSKMTVSLALRGEPRISEATRAKVRRIADRLGYAPDPALNALAAYRRQRARPDFAATIAFVNAFEAPIAKTPWRYYAHYFAGARDRARALGFVVEEFWLNAPGMKERALNRILQSRGISAVIVGPLRALHASLELEWDRFSAVALGYSMESPRLHTVANNHFQSMCTCFEELVKLGYQRIGLYLQAAQDERVMRRWSGGYLASRAVHVPESRQVPPHLFGQFELGHFGRWLRTEKPDAVITGTPELADRLAELGYAVPGKIGVAMPYETTFQAHTHLAHINENNHLNGATALDVVAGMFYRNERGIPEKPLHVMVQGEWVAGKTVRAR